LVLVLVQPWGDLRAHSSVLASLNMMLMPMPKAFAGAVLL
jgi:hypothetical protein